MAKIHLKKHVPHSADDMLGMVADVESYPEFLNFVSDLRVLSRQSISERREKFTAEVAVQYQLVSQAFVSDVYVDRGAKTIKVDRDGDGGAVKTLKNTWAFIPQVDGSCEIDVFLEVSLKSMTMEFLLKQKFNGIANQVIDAFVRRAAQVCPDIGSGVA